MNESLCLCIWQIHNLQVDMNNKVIQNLKSKIHLQMISTDLVQKWIKSGISKRKQKSKKKKK